MSEPSIQRFAADLSHQLHPTHGRLTDVARVLHALNRRMPPGETYTLFRELVTELAAVETAINDLSDQLIDTATTGIDWNKR